MKDERCSRSTRKPTLSYTEWKTESTLYQPVCWQQSVMNEKRVLRQINLQANQVQTSYTRSSRESVLKYHKRKMEDTPD